MQLSQADRIIRERGHLLYTVTGADHTGRTAFYFILVDKAKLPSFLESFDKGGMDLLAFGRIIASGYGDAPPQSLVDEIHRKYGSGG